MTGELRTAAEVASWLAVGLALRRIVPPEPAAEAGDHDDDAVVARAIAVCANELPALPPPGVIADIATLLTGARPAISAALTGTGTGTATATADDAPEPCTYIGST
jgi:hypothetical protein